ncbi:MAG: cation-translocating P-type ATPase, partial [Candidatus Bipolaricaulia bacterium]
EAIVVRGGENEKIDAENLVPGDIVELESGDKVPADVRIFEAQELETQESVLTGESSAVAKTTDKIDEERPLAERENMGYMNTHVTRGKARGIVVATGQNTEAGKIAEASQQGEEEEVPFVQEVQTTAQKISYLALTLVLGASAIFWFYGKPFYEIFMLAAALIIGSIPAALPVTVTYSLTNAMKRMARQNVLVKNLPLLETLGGVDVICTDKTGTLTKNEMAVKKFFVPGDQPVVGAEEFNADADNKLVRSALLANEAEEAKAEKGYVGDPEDVGLLNFLESRGMDVEDLKNEFEQKDFLPFSSEREMAQALVSEDGSSVRYSKGAPEVIVDRSDRILVDGEIQEFTEDWKEEVKQSVTDFSEEALRNLAFSYKEAGNEGLGEDTEGDVFLGLVGMWDPPKEGIEEAVSTCYDAGIEVNMITGDSKETAVAVAEECGFKDINAVTWEEVKDASDEEMEEIVQKNNVFARMDPELKMDMVDALHRLDKRVAITGDGVNDTPPIEAAEVGIAMGDQGSDITRDAADLILLDDNFASIQEGIRYGRTSLSNVRKVANYLMTANLFEVVVIFISSLIGFTPFRAIQLLWVNFATDIFPAMALGGDRPHPDIMNKEPTGKEESILTKRVWSLLTGIGLKKVLMVFISFFLVLYLSKGQTNILGMSGNIMMAQTTAFVWLGLSHIVRIVAIRWEEGWTWSEVFINKWVNYSLLWPLVAFAAILYTPLGNFFKSVPLSYMPWGVLIGTLAISIVLAVWIAKAIFMILGEHGATEY